MVKELSTTDNKNEEVLQYTHYYPFGMAFPEAKGKNEQAYKYNGKEQDTRLGLNLYDYSARYLDNAIPRFTSIDLHAEKYYSWSPYAYVGNNPILNIDPTGEDYWSTNDPNEINRFFESLKSRGGNAVNSHDLNTWETHLTDKEFFSTLETSYGLTFNDETEKFYASEVTFENGETVVTGYTVDKMGIPGMLPIDKKVRPNVSITPQSGKLDGLGLMSPELLIFRGPRAIVEATAVGIWRSMNPSFNPNLVISTGGTVGREKMGKARGNMSGNNQVQNKQANQIASDLRLNPDESRQLHDLISGQGYSYQQALKEAKQFFNK